MGRAAGSESVRGCPVSGTVCGEVSGGRGLGRTRARPAGPAPVAECPGQASPPHSPRGQSWSALGSPIGTGRGCDLRLGAWGQEGLPRSPGCLFRGPTWCDVSLGTASLPWVGGSYGDTGGWGSALPEAPCCPVRWELVSPSSASSQDREGGLTDPGAPQSTWLALRAGRSLPGRPGVSPRTLALLCPDWFNGPSAL